MPQQRSIAIAASLGIAGSMFAALVFSQEVKVAPESLVTATIVNSATSTEAPIVKISPYMKQCAEAGVPLPPKWGSGWRFVGELPKEAVNASELPVTEVWTYVNDLGICFALPRKDAAGSIELLGIVCQGEKSGKACFWDNIALPDGSSTRIVGADVAGMDPADIQGGDELDENCTNCHRGHNAFVVYPDTALDRWPAHNAPVYAPISDDPAWVNEAGVSRCGGCHTIPVFTEEYCRSVFKGVIGEPSDVGGWNEHARRVRYSYNVAKVQQMVDECNVLLKPTDKIDFKLAN